MRLNYRLGDALRREACQPFAVLKLVPPASNYSFISSAPIVSPALETGRTKPRNGLGDRGIPTIPIVVRPISCRSGPDIKLKGDPKEKVSVMKSTTKHARDQLATARAASGEDVK